MRTKHTFRLPPELAVQLADYAAQKRVPQALVVETALASFLSPDGADRLEAALSRRLDRINRSLERVENAASVSTEAIAVFVRFWTAATPSLPETTDIAAQATGRERYRRYLETVGRRIAARRSLADEISREIAAAAEPRAFSNQSAS